jgi:hypothetical protein
VGSELGKARSKTIGFNSTEEERLILKRFFALSSESGLGLKIKAFVLAEASKVVSEGDYNDASEQPASMATG